MMQVTSPDEAAALIGQLRAAGITLTYDPDTRTIRTGDGGIAAVTTGRDANTVRNNSQRKEEEEQPTTRRSRRPGLGDVSACPETGTYGVLTCPRDLNTETGEISPDREIMQ